MNNVIITGASGFIGSWLAQEMCNNNINAILVVRKRDRLINELRCNPLCSVVEGELEHLDKTYFKEESYDAFFHLGWGGVSSECKNNLEIQLNNINVSVQAMELAKSIGCKKFIAAGTVAEYVFSNDIMDVNEKQTPNDLYGAAKVAAHYFMDVRSRQLKLPFIWMVIPSTFGERRTDNNIITYTIRTLLRGEKPLYGNLDQMWDFLYVSEVARAIRLIGEKGQVGKVYGIGSGKYRPLREYIEIIRDRINPELELGIGEVPEYSDQTFSSCVNINDLTRDTGFIPCISFEEGIDRTIKNYKEKSE